MRRGSEWLSRGAELLAARAERDDTPVFDVVVVGSGYGGAVAAARLSAVQAAGGKPLTVCVLERGLEYLPGDFPARMEDVPAHVRFGAARVAGARGLSDGLFDFRTAGDVWALVGNGLGGGSLINAGVAEEPDDATLDETAWPAPWRGNKKRWSELFERARLGVGAQVWTGSGAPKQRAMDELAGHLTSQARRGSAIYGRSEPPILARPVHATIAPPLGSAAIGVSSRVPEAPCVQCGDCFSGCNVGAKRTLAHTYLALAYRRGAELYTGATVRRVKRRDASSGPRWSVRWVLTDARKLPGSTREFEVRANHVVLSAGTFGSTEILMRSQGITLAFSSQLGQRFSTNGDTISVQHGLPDKATSVADEKTPREERRVGPTITKLIDLRDRQPGLPLHKRMVVQEMTVPGALGWLYKELLTTLMVPQRWTRWDLASRVRGGVDRCNVDDRPGFAIDRSLLLATMGHDGSHGRLDALPGLAEERADGSLAVHWPGIAQEPCFAHADRMLKAATREMGATWLRNPLWQAAPDSALFDEPRQRKVMTNHPLGGCCMGENASQAVVDAFGRVYDCGAQLAENEMSDTRQRARIPRGFEDKVLHEGLYVLDGSIVPTSLGINPLLTITALAEGAVDEWIDCEGWEPAKGRVDVTLPPRPAFVPAPQPSGHSPTRLELRERMTGVVAAPAVELVLRCDFEAIDNLAGFLRSDDKKLGFVAHFDVSALLNDSDQPGNGPPLAPTLQLPHCSVWWFEQENIAVPRRLLRALRGWWQHRARADLVRTDNGRSPSAAGPRWLAALVALTHFGAARRLRYDFGALERDWVLADGTVLLPRGTRLYGQKELVYRAGGNPWQQLTELPLMVRPPSEAPRRLTLLEFDPLYMLGRHHLPLAVTSQASGVASIRDVASLALYFGRVMADTHFASFRAPDYPAFRPPRRLPWKGREGDSRHAGLGFEVFHPKVQTGGDGEPVEWLTLRLTRLHPRQAASDVPVLLLHGFGSGGIQFTHEKIPEPLAPWLARAGKGRDVWVGELRTSIGLRTSQRQWSMDDVARQDVPALVNEVLRCTGAKRLDIVAHCIGSAMFCMATLAGALSDAHGSQVRAAALLQVGPIIRLPRANRVRGMLASRAQQALQLTKIKSTIDERADSGDQLLDRLLAATLYPQRERAAMRLNGDLAHNRRLVNANRSAGVFGQLFDSANMPNDLMDCLGDLLGDCNLTTYQQTVHYSFAGRLTNQTGDDAYVSHDRLRRYFDFPVLFVSGEVNEVFDKQTTLDSQHLLHDVFGPAHPAHRHVVRGFGHLDSVVGKGADEKVFAVLRAFLDEPTKPPLLDASLVESAAMRRPRWTVRQPAVGPWLGDALPGEGGALTLRFGLKADDNALPPTWAASVVAIDGLVQIETLLLHDLLGRSLDADPRYRYRPPDFGVGDGWDGGEAILRKQIPLGTIGAVKELLEVWVGTLHFPPGHPLPEPEELLRAWAADRNGRAKKANALRFDPPRDSVLLTREWLDRWLDDGNASTRFVFGSCRQAPLLLDRWLADAAFARIALALDDRAAPPIERLLLVGDQIYADALAAANQVEGTRQRFVDGYREAWSAPAQSDVMRRLPTYMAVDDHEFRDNYSEAVRGGRPKEFACARGSWRRYQLAAGPWGRIAGGQTSGRTAWYEFQAGGFSHFVCDTRSGRDAEWRVDRGGARMLDDEQMRALEAWLRLTSAQTRPRFIVLPAPLFPWFRSALGDPAYAVRADNWQRFPDTFEWLINLLATFGDKVVLLCGDYHCFVDGNLEIEHIAGTRASVRCVVTSGLYCPYDVANTLAEQLAPTSSGATDVCRWRYQLREFGEGSGYTDVRVSDARVKVEFVSAIVAEPRMRSRYRHPVERNGNDGIKTMQARASPVVA